MMLVPLFNLSAATNGTNLAVSFNSQSGFKYQVQYKTNLTDATWSALGTQIPGDGTVKVFNDSTVTNAHRFYRVMVQ